MSNTLSSNNSAPSADDFFATKEIGGKKYSIQSLDGWVAWDGWTLILETVAPVFGEVLDSRNVDEEAAMFEKQNTFREILTICSHNINKPEMRVLVSKMLEGATCESETIDINKHFNKNVHEMMELVIYAFEVNFNGFFIKSDMFQSMLGGLGKVMNGIEIG